MSTRGEGGGAHVGADELGARRRARRAPARRRAAAARCRLTRTSTGACRPLARPAPWRRRAAAAPTRLASRPWPQPMSSTRDARRDQAAREEVAEDRIPAQLAAREMPGEAAGAPVRRARGVRRASRQVGAASALLVARRCSAAAAGAAAGAHAARCGAERHRREACGAHALEQRRQHREDDRRAARVRAALPSCSSRMSPAARPWPRRASIAAGSRRTVSKPRRVQLTSCRSSRCSTGARNGLRRPAGARKKRGASPRDVGERCLRGADLARHRPSGRAARSDANGGRCGSARCGRGATISRQSAGCARARAAMQKKRRARAVRVEQVEHGGRDLRIGAVVDRDRDFARGRRRGRAGASSCCRASASAARGRRR